MGSLFMKDQYSSPFFLSLQKSPVQVHPGGWWVSMNSPGLWAGCPGAADLKERLQGSPVERYILWLQGPLLLASLGWGPWAPFASSLSPNLLGRLFLWYKVMGPISGTAISPFLENSGYAKISFEGFELTDVEWFLFLRTWDWVFVFSLLMLYSCFRAS